MTRDVVAERDREDAGDAIGRAVTRRLREIGAVGDHTLLNIIHSYVLQETVRVLSERSPRMDPASDRLLIAQMAATLSAGLGCGILGCETADRYVDRVQELLAAVDRRK